MLYRLLFGAVLARIEPERAHRLSFAALRAALSIPFARRLVARLTAPAPALAVEAFGRSFPSPLGVAAGLDKDGELFAMLETLGFGHVEIGTVTPRAQPGNPAPRVFRVPAQGALINRMGFPSAGARVVREAIDQVGAGSLPLGVNIGMNRDTELDDAARDYRAAASELRGLASFVVVNVSSPNTPGLRELQSPERLAPLLDAVLEALGDRPLLLKIAPDLPDEQILALADLAIERGLAGIVCTNTTSSRDGLPPGDRPEGGLSGAPLRERSLSVLQLLHGHVGSRLVLISVGGVRDGRDVFERLRCGATLVQAYTGFVYGGPLWARHVNRELLDLLREAGLSSPAQIRS